MLRGIRLKNLPVFVTCQDCRVRHHLLELQRERWPIEIAEFKLRHRGHRVRVRRMVPTEWLIGSPWVSNANVKEAFGTNNQAFTLTITSLGSGSQRQSTAIDNSSNLYVDALCFFKIKTGTIVAPSTINAYAFGTADGGTTYSDGAGATDAAITLSSPPNMPIIGVGNAPANATIYSLGPYSVANNRYFMGVLPDHWGVVVENKTGAAFDATTASGWYQGQYLTVV